MILTTSRHWRLVYRWGLFACLAMLMMWLLRVAAEDQVCAASPGVPALPPLATTSATAPDARTRPRPNVTAAPVPDPVQPARVDRPEPQDRVPRTYKVRPGDTLYRISRRVYGRGSAWRTIYRANRARIRNPRLLQTGLTLTLPDLDATPPRHAKPGGPR